MKNQMEICVFVSDIYYLENLDETLSLVTDPKDPDILTFMDDNVKVNQRSLKKIKDYTYKYYGKDFDSNIERIYFGNETCEYLIPQIEDIKKAVQICKKHEMELSYVTPYTGVIGLEKLRENLAYLNTLDNVEVVVNDFAVLQLLNTEYTNLTPVLGRLLVKLKRDPRFSKSEYTARDKNVGNIKKVKKNQYNVMADNSLAVKDYQDFLKDKGIERVGLDMVPQGIVFKGKESTWGFPVDLYWPWTYVTSGRNCAIASHTQIGKSFHETNEPCHKQCKLFEFTFSSDKDMFTTVQRGNTVWMESMDLSEDYFGKGFGRIIYQPYIPI